ncbi:uncharacterized protein LOC125531407 [Triticum urartu]|uniref:uncharacterized protein LOC125531407 n=1 Tax=Triticum urartu TaxID=4572 RepID=UPI0020436BD8|nr:uncharacterized protein LOC125531407 [Triticum urartu]
MAASRRRILSFDIYPRPALLGAYYLSAVVGIRQRSASPPLIPRSVASRPGRPVQRRGCRRSTASRPTLSCAVHTSRCCKFWGGGSEQCSADKNVVAGSCGCRCSSQAHDGMTACSSLVAVELNVWCWTRCSTVGVTVQLIG